MEIFHPDQKVKRVEEHEFGTRKIKVASRDDIFQMKIAAYTDRKEARDLFDIFCVLKASGLDFDLVKTLVLKHGMPVHSEDIEAMAVDRNDATELQKVISNASS